MRKLFVCLLCLLPVLLPAQPVERIYVSTDRPVYIAGDQVWCSLFSLNRQDGKLSDFSAVAYLELVSTDGTTARAKVSMMNGRGAGVFRIPSSTPTGNYKLIAYTAQNTNEEGTGPYAGAKLLSVFNTSSNARVHNGVILDNASSSVQDNSTVKGNVDISLGSIVRAGAPFTLLLGIPGEVSADVTVSVYHQDALPLPEEHTLDGFKETISRERRVKCQKSRLPEYEGEIITAHLKGLPEGQEGQIRAILSSAGSPSDVYIGKTDENGTVRFFTNNIYGDRELVCEVDSQGAYLSLEDPFIGPEAGSIPALVLNRSLFSALVNRKAALQATCRADTLYTFMSRRQDILLEGAVSRHYHLDDYTRFPSVQEIIVEITPELKLRKSHGKDAVWTVATDPNTSRSIVRDNNLVMLDGVVLTDITPLLDMDAMLLEDIDIYLESVVIGGLSYNGAVNFISRKDYVKAIRFPSNVQVTDFKGVSYPMAYLGGASETERDLRQLLYWHPAFNISAGQKVSLQLKAPSYEGLFRVLVEGIDSSGVPLRGEFFFEIK